MHEFCYAWIANKQHYEEGRATQQQLSLGKNPSVFGINQKLHFVIAKQLKLFSI